MLDVAHIFWVELVSKRDSMQKMWATSTVVGIGLPERAIVAKPLVSGSVMVSVSLNLRAVQMVGFRLFARSKL